MSNDPTPTAGPLPVFMSRKPDRVWLLPEDPQSLGYRHRVASPGPEVWTRALRDAILQNRNPHATVMRNFTRESE